MRKLLKQHLEEEGAISVTGNWEHVTNQIGMFSFTGLSKAQSEAMCDKSVYMTSNGRISIVGITQANVKHVAKTMKECIESNQ